MSDSTKPINILMAEDDPDDRMLMKEALEENKFYISLNFVGDGEELLQYLRKTNSGQPHPALILLDLNMPKMDGREALRILKSDPDFRRIPVVVLTTSSAREDILIAYDLGVNSFISKPSRFADLVKITREIGSYWFKLVKLP
jgi:CheY-like chemotaxis protein